MTVTLAVAAVARGLFISTPRWPILLSHAIKACAHFSLRGWIESLIWWLSQSNRKHDQWDAFKPTAIY